MKSTSNPSEPHATHANGGTNESRTEVEWPEPTQLAADDQSNQRVASSTNPGVPLSQPVVTVPRGFITWPVGSTGSRRIGPPQHLPASAVSNPRGLLPLWLRNSQPTSVNAPPPASTAPGPCSAAAPHPVAAPRLAYPPPQFPAGMPPHTTEVDHSSDEYDDGPPTAEDNEWVEYEDEGTELFE